MKTKNKPDKKQKKTLPYYLRKEKPTMVVYVIVRIFVLFALISALLRQNYENVFVCLLTLVLFEVPTLVERTFKVDLPTTLEVIALLFVFAAEVLGELQSFYVRFPYWDTMLHTVNGFIFAAVGFALVDIFNRNQKFSFRMSPIYLAIAAFCFSMTVGVLWEFFEFGCDQLLGTDMQKDFVIHSISSVALNPDGVNVPVVISGITETTVNGQPLTVSGYLDIGLIDTMKDLLVNFVGAVIFSIIGFIYVKGREKGKGNIAKQFIPIVLNDDDIQNNNSEESLQDKSIPEKKNETEIWDAYDKNGNKTGTDLIRGEKIPKGTYHIVGEVLVRHTDGDFLLMQRDFSKPNYPGMLEATAGGSALKGETPEQCVKRELSEETGIENCNFQFFDRIVEEKNQTIYYEYFAETNCNKTMIRLQEGETVAYQWVNKKTLLNLMETKKIVPANTKRIKKYISGI